MKISLKWLNDYIDVKRFFEKSQELSQILTQAGLEVESLEEQGKAFANVVLGVILEKSQHPNADRLTVCQVSTGHGVVHQIVCGAKNHKQGDRVVVALPGAILPGDFAIKKSAIRGVESNGMLCSESELGLKKESEGILILPEDAPIGMPFSEFIKADDLIMELKVTPNRADCLSHFGLARELSGLLAQEYRLPMGSFVEGSESTKKKISLEVLNPELCPRYAGRFVANVKVGESPSWLKTRLEAVGIKSINNVVDVTNYVMMELGQPLHAFDVRQIKGNKIIVSMAKAGEIFTTLDKTEIKLTGTELMIRDESRPVALAGVVGGLNSGIQQDTSDIFIESAYFTAGGVRRTSRLHGIETDSGYRFARGVNPEAVLLALNRATELIVQLTGGMAFGDHHDFYPEPVKKQAINIHGNTLRERLGYEVTGKDFVEKLKQVGCEVTESSPNSWKVQAPVFRWDLNIDMDLVEEFARLHGYEHIPETLPMLTDSPTKSHAGFDFKQKLQRCAGEQGFTEAINYAFLSNLNQAKFLGQTSKLDYLPCFSGKSEPIPLQNPLNEELNVMRLSLLPSLTQNVIHNIRYGETAGKLFESGMVFHHEEKGFSEFHHLGLALWGDHETLWHKPRRGYAVFELKSAVEGILKSLGFKKWRWELLKSKPDFFHPGQCIGLQVGGHMLGALGMLHPGIAEEYKVNVPIALAELDVGKLLAHTKHESKVKTPSKFPSVERDLAFVLPKDMAAEKIVSSVKKHAGNHLKDIQVFDLFEGPALGEDRKSLAIRMKFQDENATLTDEILQKIQNLIIQGVKDDLHVGLR